MQAYEYDANDFTTGAQAALDKSLLVKFFIKPRQDRAASEKEGRPVFKDVEHIDIRSGGSKDVVARPATENDKRRFPQHYAAFKNRTSEAVGMGMPLSEWAAVTASQVEELAYLNIKTVEQLATVADSQISAMRGMYVLKEKAKIWLEAAQKNKPIFEMKNRLDDMERENEELKKSVSRLLEVIETPDKLEGASAQQKRRTAQRALQDAKGAVD